MVVPRMHAEEVEVDAGLVARLLTAQAPQWAGLPLRRVEAWGTDHVIFRLGDELSVRLPKIGWAAQQGEKERRWLPVLAPQVAPVEVPVPVFVGEPLEGPGGYPFRWYVSPWLPGDNPRPGVRGGDVDLRHLATDLAAFVRGLQRADTSGAPRPRPGYRGGPLAPADASTRAHAEKLRHQVDAGTDADVDVIDALLAIWDAGVRAPQWDGPLVWTHGDLADGNLLVRRGRLTGVIDWGSAVASDPAVELMVAWQVFDEDSRAAYREALGFVDDAMWLRGRAWAVSTALHALPYYRDTNPDIVARSWRAVRAVLADAGGPAPIQW